MAIDSVAGSASSQVAGAIRSAARSTGASFEYLLTTAQIESNLNPAAQATTSSAKGLYQFIEQTWLGTLKQAGAAHGYGQYADAISQGADGRYEVADPNQRAAIMRLRSDPTASAVMAGAFTQTNAAQLANAIDRDPTEGELYIAHFLGPDGAAKLINIATMQPRANAADMFPQAAAANRSIFYDSAGRGRSASEVYSKLTGRYEVARAVSFAPSQRGTITVAMAQPAPVAPIAQVKIAQNAPPDTAGVTQAYAKAHDVRPPPVADVRAPGTEARPWIQTMFTDRGDRPVTQTVSNLWTPASSDAPTRGGRLSNLFTDLPAEPRKPKA
jgi:hypothetical protein